MANFALAFARRSSVEREGVDGAAMHILSAKAIFDVNSKQDEFEGRSTSIHQSSGLCGFPRAHGTLAFMVVRSRRRENPNIRSRTGGVERGCLLESLEPRWLFATTIDFITFNDSAAGPQTG